VPAREKQPSLLMKTCKLGKRSFVKNEFAFYKSYFWHHNTQQNDTLQNDTQQNNTEQNDTQQNDT
jgi:hypothetical protein